MVFRGGDVTYSPDNLKKPWEVERASDARATSGESVGVGSCDEIPPAVTCGYAGPKKAASQPSPFQPNRTRSFDTSNSTQSWPNRLVATAIEGDIAPHAILQALRMTATDGGVLTMTTEAAHDVAMTTEARAGIARDGDPRAVHPVEAAIIKTPIAVVESVGIVTGVRTTTGEDAGIVLPTNGDLTDATGIEMQTTRGKDRLEDTEALHAHAPPDDARGAHRRAN